MRYPRYVSFGCLLLAACGDDTIKTKAQTDAGGGKTGGQHETDAGHKPSKCAVTLKPGDDDQSALQGALIDAKSGQTVCLSQGRYKLTGQLSLATENVTLLGVADSVLDFSAQSSGANAIELSANHDTLDTFTIENPKGDGVRATEVDYPTIRNVRVVWTGGPSENNGGYGVYPVTSSHVLVETSYVKGASDTGIYVGQSHDIVVRNNEVEGNVAGIEIENSTDAEVYANHSHGNSAGILVFNLPGLNVKDGKRANVHDNQIEDNNLANFAAAGNIVHDVPPGTGMFILAADDNEVHGNTIQKHDSVGLAVLSWYVALRDAEGMKDPEYNWFPERNNVHDNMFSDNGKSPKGTAAAIADMVGMDTNPDIVWDGFVDPDKLDNDAGSDSSLLPPESVRNCFKANGDATFISADLEHNGANKSSDVTPFECVRDALPSIKL